MTRLRVMCRILFMVAVLATGAAQAERRVALIIGNANYQHVPPLQNSLNDAGAIARTLEQVGFETVELAVDQDARAMRQAIRAFSTKVEDAEVALVYFAGHGLETGGRNYLIPTDAKLASDLDLEFEAVSLQLLLRAIEPAKRMRIVILDACRNNPFAAQMAISGRVSRSLGRGLAKVEPSADTLVAFAARDGTVAADGSGPHSPYAEALMQHLPTPGLEIGLLFRRVRDSVLDATNRQQEPFVYGSLGGAEFYFMAPSALPATVNGISTVPRASAEYEADLALWMAVRDSNDTGLIESYLERFPQGLYAAVALHRIGQLRGKVGELKVASLPPPTFRAEDSKKGEPELARNLQRELARVGCDPGEVDGIWTKKSQSALERFNQRTRLALYVDEPSEAALRAVASQAVRVCPQICATGERLDEEGKCVKVPVRSVAPKPSSPSRTATTSAVSDGSGPGSCRSGNMARCRQRCAEGEPRACARVQRGW